MLASALFSNKEKTPIIQGVPQTEEEIVREIYRIDNEEHIRHKLSGYSNAIRMSGGFPNDADYFLVITNMLRNTIEISAFKRDEIVLATEIYQQMEKKATKDRLDVVLVAAKNFRTLKDSYPNYFLEAQLFLSNIAELCAQYPEKSSVSLSLATNSSRVTELVTVMPYQPCIPNDIDLPRLDGIGIPDSDLVYCPSERITLTDSYLRFSGITIPKSLLENTPSIKPIYVKGPGIIILREGASFFINKDEWSYITQSKTLLVQPKEGINSSILFVLICWLKSNICTWDLVWNKHRHSAYYKTAIESLCIPNLQDDKVSLLYCLTKSILQDEAKFVSDYNCSDLRGDFKDTDEDVYRFNQSILTKLREIENVFERFYQISNKDLDTIANELKLKGLFSYREQT